METELSSIIVLREDRVRREVTPAAIESMAESFARIGQITPICIERDTLVLIAGETRYEAAKRLGWTHIKSSFFDELTEAQRLEIEIEENVKRTDLPWQDHCAAILRYHRMKADAEPAWSTADTARAIGYTQKTIQDQLRVAEAITSGNARVASAPKYSVAKNVVQRQDERRRADEIATLFEDEDDVQPESPIVVADFNSWADEYVGPSFNFIHCDFPYGIDADSFNQGAGASMGGYDDSFGNYVSLIDALERNLVRLGGSSCHIMFWFSMRHYSYTLDRLQKMGLWLDPVPLIWHKSDNTGALPDPQRGPRRIYETAFWCSLGDRKILTAKSNVCAAPVTRLADHMSEKSEAMLRHFMSMAIDEHTRLLDPTCGSGSALRAADKLGAAMVVGLEANEEFAANATRAWNARNG